MQKGHRYRITVAPVDQHGEPVASSPPLAFHHRNHDDLLHIVTLVSETSGLDDDQSAAMAIGLKLLGQTMLEQRGNPLFDGLRAPLRDFHSELKARRR